MKRYEDGIIQNITKEIHNMIMLFKCAFKSNMFHAFQNDGDHYDI